jgi:hypothetical protein
LPEEEEEVKEEQLFLDAPEQPMVFFWEKDIVLDRWQSERFL